MAKTTSKKTKSTKKPVKQKSAVKKISRAGQPKKYKIYKVPKLFVAAIAFIAFSAGAVFLMPESSPFSFASLTGRGTDRVAPKLDTLKGNYSVVGEASSSSLLVKYKSNVAKSSREKINNQLGASTKRNISRLGVEEVKVVSNEPVGETIRKFRSKPEVEFVEPNYAAKRFYTPNDNLYSKQWHLSKINAAKAWEVSKGGYGPIAIIDTGIMSSQTDLSGQVLSGYNFVSDNTNTSDDNGHGTHVAGIVAASTDNSAGIASIGFKGTLLPVKVLDASGSGTYSDVASGITYAADRGAKIINLSLGGPSYSRTLENAVKYAQSKGSLIVAAAGNNGNDEVIYPAGHSGVIAVTASNSEDQLAPFSSFGSHVYISAPGTSIISTYNSGGYATLSGTSMATPAVSGLIGLALSKGSTTITKVISDLKTKSDKIGPYPYDSNGWNRYFGYGRINAEKLLGYVAVNNTTETSTAEDSTTTDDTPKPGRSGTNGSVQFDTVVRGTMDSIEIDRGVIVIKVTSSSSNLKLNENNLVDIYITNETTAKLNGKSFDINRLKTGDKLKIKAHWEDNKLKATEISTSGRQASGLSGFLAFF